MQHQIISDDFKNRNIENVLNFFQQILKYLVINIVIKITNTYNKLLKITEVYLNVDIS